MPIVRKAEDNYMDIELKMNRRESLVVLVNREKSPKVNYQSKTTAGAKMILDNIWYMGPDYENLEKMSKLIPWNKINGMEHYSGSMIYRIQFFMEEDLKNKKAELNLGEVNEIARVSLNGYDLGVQMWSPYLFQAAGYIRKGQNVLIIEVKNTLANKICGLNLKSGLIGPVSLNFLDVIVP